MYALINTMTAWDNYIGSVESCHRTREAAEKADAALQRSLKRYNGSNSYLPTIIKKVDGNPGKGILHSSNIIEE